MLTVDARCGAPECAAKNLGVYRMVGTCSNCMTKDILFLFSEEHKGSAWNYACPTCKVYGRMTTIRPATDDEIPEGALGKER